MKRVVPAITLFLLFTSFYSVSNMTRVFVFAWNYGDSHHSIEKRNDTIIFHYLQFTLHLKDSLDKYVSKPAEIKTMLMAQPSMYIDSIDFGKFTGLEKIILSGNDADYLDSSHFAFLKCPRLKQVSCSAVFLIDDDWMHDPEYHFKDRMRKFVHLQRPDVKVKFLRWDRYYHLLWEDN